MKLRAFDACGEPLDHVRDVRLEWREGEWIVTDLVVGSGAFAERLGFVHGAVERPLLLARLMRWLGRHARIVPWDCVVSLDERVDVDALRDDLPRPEGYR
ncbi:MAG: hypothetical protein M3134_07325 [Actinomycetota bacterium]|nr:hypothetical protein [Actinomycetota bacterium]